VTKDPGAEVEDPFEGDAHGLLEHPFTSRLLWEEIARAVHTASADELRSQRVDEFVEARIQRETRSTTTMNSSTVLKEDPAAKAASGIVVSYLLEENNNFRTLFQTVLGRDLTEEEAQKNVSEAAVTSIRELIQVVVARKGKTKKAEHFLSYLDDCVRDWLLDALTLSEYKATKILRDKLLRYEVVARKARTG
jgi:hypothetical protein